MQEKLGNQIDLSYNNSVLLELFFRQLHMRIVTYIRLLCNMYAEYKGWSTS